MVIACFFLYLMNKNTAIPRMAKTPSTMTKMMYQARPAEGTGLLSKETYMLLVVVP